MREAQRFQGNQPQALWDLVAGYLAAERLELDDLELAGIGRGRVLRVVVDGENSVDLDRLTDISRGLSRMLDARSQLQGPYQLEVTSPGLERKLRRARHFQKSIGREVVVKVRRGGTGSSVRGVLTGSDGEGFDVEGEAGPHRVRYDEVESARTVFRWERPPRPGR